MQPSRHLRGPPMRWIIDGMNVIGTRPDGWWRDRHGAMVNLVDRLERWAAADGEDVSVVFEQPPRPPIRSSVVDVVWARQAHAADSADDEIVRRLSSSPTRARSASSPPTACSPSRSTRPARASTPSSTFRSEIDPRCSMF